MKIVLLEETNSRKSGGLYFSVRNLAISLKNHCKAEVMIACCDDEYSTQDKSLYGNVPLLIYHKSKLPLLNRYAYSTDLYNLLEEVKPDVIETQGLWMYFSYAAYKYKKNHPSTKLVIVPRGMLDRINIKNEPFHKRLIYRLYEKQGMNNADSFVALCEPEIEGFNSFHIKVPVAVIPNGFTLPDIESPISQRDKVVLFIGRIHPKKGLRELIEGINILNKRYPELLKQWKFRIAGWDQNGHIQELISLCNKYQLNNSVQFIGQVYNENKINELIKADAFVLTSFSEGLPMSILEAWAYKLPVIMTDGCNLPDGFEHNAAIRTTTNPQDIAEDLHKMMLLNDSELKEIGKNGYELVRSSYQWNVIAEKHMMLFHWLFKHDNKPSFIK